MSKSTLTLYRIDNLVRGQNKIIEYIGSLLALAPQQVEMTNYQYQQLDDLTCTVKVVLPEAYQTPGARVTGVVDYNYASIVQDNKTLYYYILSKSWLSTSAIKITMELDTLNSFCLKFGHEFNRGMFSGRTLVKRAHKDRFDRIEVSGGTAYLRRLIDPYPEGLDVELLTNTDNKLGIFDVKHNNDLQWYIVYLTEYDITSAKPLSPENPVLLTYCANETIQIDTVPIPPNILNRSNPRIIKIIRVPYPPENINDSGEDHAGIFNGSGERGWTSLDIQVPQAGSTTPITRKVRAYEVSRYMPEGALERYLTFPPNLRPTLDMATSIGTAAIVDTHLRTLKDSKLYNSNYYYRKYYYDSFSWDFRAEAYDVNKIPFNPVSPPSFSAVYMTSKNVNGNLAFRFHDFHERQDQRAGTSDFPKIMPVSRNNEVAIYTNEYLNYLMTGYNYDQKAKALATRSAIVNTALSAVGAIAGGNVAGGITTAVTGGLAIAKQSIQMQTEIDRKITQMQNQASSVSGCDDSDILQGYGGNVLHQRIYQVSNRMEEMLNNLFYYYGYADNHYGITEADVKSRCWFNFLQADVELASSVYNDNIRQDITDKMRQGVTIFHARYDEHGDYTRRDLEQKYENWEGLFNL